MHVDVDVDHPAAGEPLAHLGLERLERAAQRGELAVDRLRLVRHAAPRQVGARLAQLLEQRGLAHEPLELAGEHVDVAGLEQQPVASTTSS